MKVTRGQTLARGLTNCCPNCGAHALFPPRSLRINDRCPECSLDFNRGEGYFLGPWCLNYSVAVFGVVLPAIVLGARGVLPWSVALVVAVAGCLVVPALLYRVSWSWWLMLYFYFLPERLPANGGLTGGAAED